MRSYRFLTGDAPGGNARRFRVWSAYPERQHDCRARAKSKKDVDRRFPGSLHFKKLRSGSGSIAFPASWMPSQKTIALNKPT